MNDFVLLLGRLLASAIFLVGGYGKVTAMAATVAFFTKIGIPMPEIAYYGAVAIELGGGALLLIGLFTRPVALILAVFCIVTAVLAHLDFGNQAQQINFMKNLCMAGGFLAFMAAGPGVLSVDGRSME